MKRIKKDRSIKIVAYVCTSVWTLLILLPMFYLLASSMKDDLLIYDTPPTFLPRPPKSVSVYMDYTDLNKGEDPLVTMQKDSTLVLYSMIYELNKEGIFDVRFLGMQEGKVVYESSASKFDLQMNLSYLVYDRAQVNQANLLERYERSLAEVGYRYEPEGLGEAMPKEDQRYEKEETIKTFLTEKFGTQGKFVGAFSQESYRYAFYNYAGCWKLPQILFSNVPSIAQFSFLWFGINTAIVVIFAVIAQVSIDSLAAFALSRLFPSKVAKVLLLVIMGAAMIPFVAYMIPMYVMFEDLKLANTYMGMLIPHVTAVGFFVYLFKGFMDQLPNDLFESATIDGASTFKIFVAICMPLSKPVTAVIAINTILGAWNDFFWPYLINKDQSLWTLNVALYNFTANSQIKQNFLMGFALLTILPLLLIVGFFAETLEKGIVFTGVKG